MTAAHVLDKLTHFGILERRDCMCNQLRFCLLPLFVGGDIHLVIRLRFFAYDILIKGVQQIFGDLSGVGADRLGKLTAFGVGHLAVQTDDAVGKRGQRVLVLSAAGDIEHQLAHRNRGLALQGACFRLLRFGNAHGVYDHKMIFVFRCRRADLLQVVL